MTSDMGGLDENSTPHLRVFLTRCSKMGVEYYLRTCRSYLYWNTELDASIKEVIVGDLRIEAGADLLSQLPS